MKLRGFYALFLLIGLLNSSSWAGQQIVTVPVGGQANVFGSGHAYLPQLGGGGGGVSPVEIAIGPGLGRVMTVMAATGTVTCDGSSTSGPDGGKAASGATNLCSYDGISGIIYGPEADPKGKTMFLVGVFLNDSEPQQAPVRLDFSETVETDTQHHAFGEHFLELSPVLGQTFFIGDGLTDTGMGTTQTFHVPDEATRLFLGFADSWDFGHLSCDCGSRDGCVDRGNELDSLPGYYYDNTGHFDVTLEFHDGEIKGDILLFA